MLNNPVENTFQFFFQPWLARQRNYRNQLRLLSSQNHREEELKSLVAEVLVHYQVYYQAKSRVANRDVFILFSPPWFSTFERSFLWITGFKPAIMFKVLEKTVGNELTVEQDEKVEKLRVETTSTEKLIDDEMALIQESMTGRSWVEATMRMGRPQQVNSLIESVKERLRDLVTSADILRTTTAKDLVDILDPFQAARFLVAIANLHLRIRALGLQKDEERRNLE